MALREISRLIPATSARTATNGGLTVRVPIPAVRALVADIKPGNVVLLGHITPVTRLYLKKAAPAAKVYSDTLNTPEKLNFVLVNNSDQILQYFENCLPKTDENTVMAFSDIYGSEETKKAWQQIKMHSQVTVTIDLFWIGLIFFRKGQVKEDFLIRI